MHLNIFIDIELNAFKNIAYTLQKKKGLKEFKFRLLKSTSVLNVMIY